MDLSGREVSLELAGLLDIELSGVLFGAERNGKPPIFVQSTIVVGRENLVVLK